jgi:hypothetical protein
MIYRILANTKQGYWDVSHQKFVSRIAGPLRGAWTAGVEGMSVKYPARKSAGSLFLHRERLAGGWPSNGRASDSRRAYGPGYTAEESRKVADLLS